MVVKKGDLLEFGNNTGPITNLEDFGSDSWKVHLYSMIMGAPNPIEYNHEKGIPASIQLLMKNGMYVT